MHLPHQSRCNLVKLFDWSFLGFEISYTAPRVAIRLSVLFYVTSPTFVLTIIQRRSLFTSPLINHIHVQDNFITFRWLFKHLFLFFFFISRRCPRFPEYPFLLVLFPSVSINFVLSNIAAWRHRPAPDMTIDEEIMSNLISNPICHTGITVSSAHYSCGSGTESQSLYIQFLDRSVIVRAYKINIFNCCSPVGCLWAFSKK